MSRHNRAGLRAVAWSVPFWFVLLLLAAAEVIVDHSVGLAACLAGLPVAAYLIGYRRGRRQAGGDDGGR